MKTDLPRRLTQSRAGDIEIWQVILTFASVFVAGMQTEKAKRSADEAKRSADEAKRSADQEFKASAEGKIHAAVTKVMKPFEPSNEEKEVFKRPVMGTIKDRIKSWKQHATIIGGRFLSGKSVAVEEALRGVRGVFRFTIKNAEWETEMYKQLRVDDIGVFKEVMSQVCEKLKDFPDNLTKHPILVLEIPRTTTTPEGLTSVLKFALGRNCPSLCHGERCGVGQDRRRDSCP